MTFSGAELVQAGSISLFLGPSDGLHSHSLLLDEERGRLLLGTRDYIYLLDPDNLARAPRKVLYVINKMKYKNLIYIDTEWKTKPQKSLVL